MIYIGVDLHRRFCLMTALDASGARIDQRRVVNDAPSLYGYFTRWSEPVTVAVEACGFWPAFTDTVTPLVTRLVLVHPQGVKAIASAKLKNDWVDSATLAHLLRTNLLPEAWVADPATRALRQLVRLRMDVVQQRTRWKNRIHAVLHQHGWHVPVSDLFGVAGRAWLAQLPLPAPARGVVDAALGLIDQFDQQIRLQEQRLAQWAEGQAEVHHLMSVPGIERYSALVSLAEIGDVRRFATKRQLYSYAGLAPRVRQSGEHTRSGGITHAGSPRLRWILVEAALNAVRHSPAAQHYFERLRRRKHPHVARVALARKLLGAVYALLRDGVCFEEQAFAAV